MLFTLGSFRFPDLFKGRLVLEFDPMDSIFGLDTREASGVHFAGVGNDTIGCWCLGKLYSGWICTSVGFYSVCIVFYMERNTVLIFMVNQEQTDMLKPTIKLVYDVTCEPLICQSSPYCMCSSSDHVIVSSQSCGNSL